jgi:hypothetical protein
VGNACDRCDGFDDNADRDDDGTADGCDDCPDDNPNDPDGDFVCQSVDNCPAMPNSQVDSDADGLGDECDNCPSQVNAGQEDEDGDDVGDDCDECPGTPGGTSVFPNGCPSPPSWSSDQKLAPGVSNGYRTPEVYDLDNAGNLVLARLNITAATIEFDLEGDALLYSSFVDRGVLTPIYRLVQQPFAGFIQTTEQSVQIDAFLLDIVGAGATWTFDYSIADHRTDSEGTDTTTTRRYQGTQIGNVTLGGTRITWVTLNATVTTCSPVCGAARPLTTTEFPLGIWTRD